MSNADWLLALAAQMQALDRYTIECLDIPGDLLMESAGRSVVREILPYCNAPEDRVLVVCGTGNNGGDGFVVARHLHLLGVAVDVALVGDASKFSNDAQRNFARLAKLPLTVHDWTNSTPSRVENYTVVVDAIFGTGLTRAVEDAAAAAIECLNASRPKVRVVAIDLPSGLHADTGQALGPCVTADLTVTMGLPKPGLILEPGASFAGHVKVARIGICDRLPITIPTQSGVATNAVVSPQITVWTRTSAGARMPKRPAHGHKGSFGHVLIVAGSEGKTGAAALAAEAAGRTGTGLVTLACPASLNPILERKCTEAMTAPIVDGGGGFFVEEAFDAVAGLAQTRDVVALGPGLGQHPQTVRFVRRFVETSATPMVIDADGLNALTPEILQQRFDQHKSVTILTPHPGEAGRLLGGLAASVINADRITAAQRLANASSSIVVLKGAATVIAEPLVHAKAQHRAVRVVINPTGGPYLATGGTGDVLTGMVAALLAQGLSAFEAAALAVYLHGAAADRLAAKMGSSGLLAGDLLGVIPEVAEALRSEAATSKTRRWIADDLSISFPEP